MSMRKADNQILQESDWKASFWVWNNQNPVNTNLTNNDIGIAMS